MEQIHTNATDFLNDIFRGAKLDLDASPVATDGGEAAAMQINITGEDSGYLRAEGGEMLDAVEHLVNQIFGHDLDRDARIICDVEGFRATRELELRAMARHAAERVRATNAPFTFGPMNSNERRIIHLALSDDHGLRTESVGDGYDRRLKVYLK